MKKVKFLFPMIISLTIALSLTSCTAFLGGIAQDPTESPTEPPTEPADPADPIDSNEEPTAGTLECFTVFPEGEYLPEEFRTSDPLPGFDYVASFHGSSVGGTPTSCSTETTYYYLGESRKMLYYMDKATGVSGPLCGKPECLHTDSTCNGYIGDRGYGLSLYDGRIWWISLGLGATVHSCALDGTDHREELQISRDLVGTVGVPDIYFHRGTMYWVETSTEIVGAVEKTHNEIIAFPLDGGDPYFIYRADPAVGGGFPMVYFLRDKLLLIFDRTEIDRDKDHSITDWRPAIDIYLFDLNTRQLETLFSGETDFFPGGDWPVLQEDGIYFVCGTVIEDGSWIPTSRFLPWEGGSFVPFGYQSWYGWCFDGRFIKLNLSDDKLTVTEQSISGKVILDKSFPVSYTGNRLLLYMQGWDEDFYYIQLPSVQVAVATNGSFLYYLDGTEKTK